MWDNKIMTYYFDKICKKGMNGIENQLLFPDGKI